MEIVYDPIGDELFVREPGFIGSWKGYRYVRCLDLEKDMACLLSDLKILKRLIKVCDL